MASAHAGITEEDLSSDVEVVERRLPIPGHHNKYDRSGRSESISTKTLSDGSSSYSSDIEDSEISCDASNRSDGSRRSHRLIDVPADGEDSTTSSVMAEPELDGRTPHFHAIPRWFPTHVKNMYEVDRKGGSLKFDVSQSDV